MKNGVSRSVVYTGRAQHSWAAFPCSSCHAGICEPCVPNLHTGPVPHRCRIDLAEAIGLRDVADAPLLESHL